VTLRYGLVGYFDPPYTITGVAIAIAITAGGVGSMFLLQADYPILSALAVLPLLIIIADAIRVAIMYPATQFAVIPSGADGAPAEIGPGRKVIRGHKRCRMILPILWVGAGILIAYRFLYWPQSHWIGDHVDTWHCHNYFGIGGNAFVLALLMWSGPLVAAVVAVLLANCGRKIVQSGEFPSPGAWVCKDTVVETGSTVILRGYWSIVVSVAVLLLVSYAVYLSWPFVAQGARPFTGDEAACLAKAGRNAR